MRRRRARRVGWSTTRVPFPDEPALLERAKERRAASVARRAYLVAEEGTRMIMRLLGLASVADAGWQLLDRKGWARFWERSIVKLRKPTATSTAIAAGELLLGAWLVLGAARRRRGAAAKFHVSKGHHPITAA